MEVKKGRMKTFLAVVVLMGCGLGEAADKAPIIQQSAQTRAIPNPGALPVEFQVQQLRDLVNQLEARQRQLAQELQAMQRDFGELKARHARHSHSYTAPGNYVGLSADQIVPRDSVYRGKGLVILGGPGTPGNAGKVYRINNDRTSGPIE